MNAKHNSRGDTPGTLRHPGTYVLLVKLPKRAWLSFGRSGTADLKAGLYGYVGSALGPGGLTARLKRYLMIPQRRHWHMDYLIPHVDLLGALIRTGGKRRECGWSDCLRDVSESYVSSFGATDCRCRSHLYYLGG